MSKITYEDIQRVNQELKSVVIKDTAYALVKERVDAFRKLCPDGCIETEIYKLEDGICVIRAFIYEYKTNDSYKLLATNEACEKEGSSFINESSYVENCSTSAIGRALSMLDLGIDNSIASYEEVANAKLNQETGEVVNAVTKAQLTYIQSLYSGDELQSIMSDLKIDKIEDLAKEQASNLIKARK